MQRRKDLAPRLAILVVGGGVLPVADDAQTIARASIACARGSAHVTRHRGGWRAQLERLGELQLGVLVEHADSCTLSFDTNRQ